MRMFVFAVAAVCIAEPTFAREPTHKRSQPMAPATFARTDAVDTPLARGDNWQPAPAQNFAGFSDPSQPRMRRAVPTRNTSLDSAIARHASANGLPVDLVHRVVKRESNYNARASSKGNIGLMQIRYQTARGIGYTGSAAGLLDAETNLTYAVRYLAGAYQAAGGNHEPRGLALCERLSRPRRARRAGTASDGAAAAGMGRPAAMGREPIVECGRAAVVRLAGRAGCDAR